MLVCFRSRRSQWHGGMIKDAYLPHNRGFDSAFGYYEGAIDYYKHTIGDLFGDGIFNVEEKLKSISGT